MKITRTAEKIAAIKSTWRKVRDNIPFPRPNKSKARIVLNPNAFNKLRPSFLVISPILSLGQEISMYSVVVRWQIHEKHLIRDEGSTRKYINRGNCDAPPVVSPLKFAAAAAGDKGHKSPRLAGHLIKSQPATAPLQFHYRGSKNDPSNGQLPAFCLLRALQLGNSTEPPRVVNERFVITDR